MILVANGQRFRIVAAAAADFTSHVHVRKKIHFDAAQAVALAGFAAAAFDVETETAGAIAAFARFGKHGKKLADGPEDAGVRSGIRTRRAADGGLVDFDHFIDELNASDFAMGAEGLARAVELLRERAIEDVVYQRRFAGAGDAGDDSKQA